MSNDVEAEVISIKEFGATGDLRDDADALRRTIAHATGVRSAEAEQSFASLDSRDGPLDELPHLPEDGAAQCGDR